MGIRDWLGGSDGTPADGFCQKGEGQLARGKTEASIQTFNRGLELDRGHAGCWNGMGKAYAVLERYDRAEECFSRALDIDPDYPEAITNKAGALRNLARKTKDALKCLEAIELCNRALTIRPEFAPAYHEKGMALWMLGKRDDAIKFFDKARKVDQAYEYPWELKGRYLFDLRKYHESIDSYEQIIRTRPDDPDILYGMGRSLMKIGAYQHAISFFTRCLKHRPDFAPAWLLLGNSYKVLHKYDEAIDAYETAMEQDPGSTKYRKNIADVYLVMGNQALYKEGRYQDAIQLYDRTIKIIPNHINAWFSRGIAFRKLGAFRNATNCFLRVVEMDPNNAHAYYEMGQLLERSKNLEEAVRCYLETIRSDPSHTDAMYKLGNILVEVGDYKGAIQYFDQIIDKKSDSSVAWYAKGKALQMNGQDTDAERCFERAGKLAAAR